MGLGVSLRTAPSASPVSSYLDEGVARHVSEVLVALPCLEMRQVVRLSVPWVSGQAKPLWEEGCSVLV